MTDLSKYLPVPSLAEENIKIANEFANPGTVKHFAMRLGFMPHNEDEAEKILASIIKESDI